MSLQKCQSRHLRLFHDADKPNLTIIKRDISNSIYQKPSGLKARWEKLENTKGVSFSLKLRMWNEANRETFCKILKGTTPFILNPRPACSHKPIQNQTLEWLNSCGKLQNSQLVVITANSYQFSCLFESNHHLPIKFSLLTTNKLLALTCGLERMQNELEVMVLLADFITVLMPDYSAQSKRN